MIVNICHIKFKKKKENPDLIIYAMLILSRYDFPIAKHLAKYLGVIKKKLMLDASCFTLILAKT